VNAEFTPLEVKYLGLQDYESCWLAMKEYTDKRTADSSDQCWFVEHPSVLTLGQAGKPEHILQASNIPIIKTDRGGQVTFHAPGQLVLYFLIDLKRKNMGVRECVSALEQSVLSLLSVYGLEAELNPGAPGVYIHCAKIASLGLRVRKGCTYHGLSLNVNMDLSPFNLINPCGYPGLEVTQMSHFLGESIDMEEVKEHLLQQVLEAFHFSL